jgi:hypothetical protein
VGRLAASSGSPGCLAVFDEVESETQWRIHRKMVIRRFSITVHVKKTHPKSGNAKLRKACVGCSRWGSQDPFLRLPRSHLNFSKNLMAKTVVFATPHLLVEAAVSTPDYADPTEPPVPSISRMPHTAIGHVRVALKGSHSGNGGDQPIPFWGRRL